VGLVTWPPAGTVPSHRCAAILLFDRRRACASSQRDTMRESPAPPQPRALPRLACPHPGTACSS
jgi:hypothetical protein